MRILGLALGSACTFLALSPAGADDLPLAKPEMVLDQIVASMPRAEKQQLRVLTATIAPGQRTPFHTHRYPVTIYVLEGAFTLDLDGNGIQVIKAGSSFVEPPNVKMTGYNKSATEPMKVVIFYVSDPKTPFLDPVK
jgi:quercetin dioxygenase-like cupin family protein